MRLQRMPLFRLSFAEQFEPEHLIEMFYFSWFARNCAGATEIPCELCTAANDLADATNSNGSKISGLMDNIFYACTKEIAKGLVNFI